MVFVKTNIKQSGQFNDFDDSRSVSTVQSFKDNYRQEFKTFEEVHRTSYSHGLEEVYTLETVDLKTVRRISDSTTPLVSAKDANSLTTSIEQLEFDFGDNFRTSMDSFLLKQPIQVLGLLAHAEKNLLAQGLSNIEQLLKSDLNKLVFVKGMGQGHIDDIKEKLREYLKGQSLYQVSTLDLAAWLRSNLAALNRKKLFIAMEPYGLSHLFPLSSLENIEVRRLTLEKRQEWQQDIQPELISKRSLFVTDAKRITEAYIKPWMRRRLGFATQDEIMERLQRISSQQEIVVSVLDFLSQIYGKNTFFFATHLRGGLEGIYFADADTEKQYNRVLGKAMTYFYKKEISYTISSLVFLLAKEFAKDWESIPMEFIEKTLRNSPAFTLAKDLSGKLLIRLA